MIVKVRKANDVAGFLMLGNIKRISVYTGQVQKWKDVKGFDYWELEKLYKKHTKPNDEALYTIIYVTHTDGTHLSIVFDTVAFILNDEGKTIEVIRQMPPPPSPGRSPAPPMRKTIEAIRQMPPQPELETNKYV